MLECKGFEAWQKLAAKRNVCQFADLPDIAWLCVSLDVHAQPSLQVEESIPESICLLLKVSARADQALLSFSFLACVPLWLDMDSLLALVAHKSDNSNAER